MCGIAGIINSRHSDTNLKRSLEAMLATLAHRGPDDSGLFIDQHTALGHQRLAIIDLEHGSQPMLSSDGRYCLVFNGEIYNYIELRQTLHHQGIQFRTQSDTEVLLHLLIQYGESALEKIDGMFAFAFYDKHTQQYLLARDEFGIKPLYYTFINDQLIFASEIKALLTHPDITVKRNTNALNHYLVFQIPLLGETLFENIYELQPAHLLKSTAGIIAQPREYWHIQHQVDETITEKDAAQQLSQLLEENVRQQIRSDVPVGAYLSGGVDSSIVSSLASKALSSQLATFTGRFSETGFDESPYAKLVNERINARPHFSTPTLDEFISLLPQIIYALDQPLAGPGVFPQYIVSQQAKQHVKVILGGQGGDELFGGYSRYLIAYLEQALKGAIFETQEEGKHIVTLNTLIKNLPMLKEYTPLMKQFWSKGLFDSMESRYFHLIDRSPNVEKLLSEEALSQFNKEAVYEDFKQVFNRTKTQSYINKMTYFDFKTLLPALLTIEDRVSMAASIEARVPLLSKKLVNLITSLPPSFKFSGGHSKHILKEACKNLLPKQVVSRKDKMGFPVPLTPWLKEPRLREFVNDTLLCQSSRQRGLFSPQALESLGGKQNFDRQLWGALSLELWHQRFID